MKVLKKRKKRRRGYPIAVLVGIEETYSMVWKIFSKVIKPEKTLTFKGQRKNSKDLYNFHESIINALRPSLKEGTKSIILVSKATTAFSKEIIEHVNQHHKWLIQGQNQASFSSIAGSATNISQVIKLTKSSIFQQIIDLTTAQETENLISILEKNLSSSDGKSRVFFSIEEVETLIVKNLKSSKIKPEYLLLTDKFLSENPKKSRLNRIMQIAANRNVKTRVVNAESQAGLRLSQLGGIVSIAQIE